MDRLDQLEFAKQCYERIIELGSKESKVFHALRSIQFDVYVHCCEQEIKEDYKNDLLLSIFTDLFKTWSQGVESSKETLNNIINRLETDVTLKQNLPVLYLFMYSLIGTIQEKNITEKPKEKFTIAYCKRKTKINQIVN